MATYGNSYQQQAPQDPRLAALMGAGFNRSDAGQGYTPSSYQMPPSQAVPNPMADATVPGTTTAATTPAATPGGIGAPSGGFYQGLIDMLLDPQAAARKGLMQRGINPWSTGFGVQRVLSRAQDIIQNLIPELAGNPTQDINQAVSDRIGTALSGGAVFHAPGALQASLQGLKGLQDQYNAAGVDVGNTNPALAALGTILSDPGQGAGLLAALATGGQSDKMRSIGRSRFGELPNLMDILTSSAPQGTYTGQESILDLLMGGQFNNPAALLQRYQAAGGAPQGAAQAGGALSGMASLGR